MTSWSAEVKDLALLTSTVANFVVEWDGGIEDFLLPTVIHDGILRFAGPHNLAACETLAEDVQRAADDSSLNVDDVVNSTTNATDGWSGDAKDAFVEYMGQVASAVNAQTRVLDGLAETSKAYSSVVNGMKTELTTLITDASLALEAATMHPLDIGKQIIEALGAVATGSLVSGIISATDIVVAHTQAANTKIEILYALAAGLDDLWSITVDSLTKVEKGYAYVTEYMLDRALTLNPPTPPMAMGVAFDPVDFASDSPEFSRHAKVTRAPLVRRPERPTDAADILIDGKRHQEAARRRTDRERIGGR